METFGEKIKSLRKERGLNLIQVADAIGVNKSAISFWENGINEPKASYIKALANLFDVTTDYLLGLTDDWGNVTLSAGAISGNHNTVNSHNTINSTAPTTPDEAELLALWRTAPKEKKNAILQLLK